MLRYKIDRARPGLVAFYDIWPGNGAGLFLQPLNPHRATLPSGFINNALFHYSSHINQMLPQITQTLHYHYFILISVILFN